MLCSCHLVHTIIYNYIHYSHRLFLHKDLIQPVKPWECQDWGATPQLKVKIAADIQIITSKPTLLLSPQILLASLTSLWNSANAESQTLQQPRWELLLLLREQMLWIYQQFCWNSVLEVTPAKVILPTYSTVQNYSKLFCLLIASFNDTSWVTSTTQPHFCHHSAS